MSRKSADDGVFYHYTDRKGYNSLRAGVAWTFKIHQPPPRDSNHPIGAYFSTLPPWSKRLCQQLKIPKEKTEFVFAFQGGVGLSPLQGGKGDRIYYSEVDYVVEKPRQLPLRSGEVAKLVPEKGTEDSS